MEEGSWERPRRKESFLAKKRQREELLNSAKRTVPVKADPTKDRVQKIIAAAGLCSRREAEEWIAEGRVQVNGKTIKLGDQAGPGDKVTVNGAPIPIAPKIYYMLHKPKGYVTTTKDIYGQKTVVELVPSDERLYPVGRLDKDTTGLILLTNDGEFANRIMHPRYEIKKTYIATIDQPFDKKQMELFKRGIRLEEGIVRPEVKVLSARRLQITVHQGYTHVIKRMLRKLGYWVKELHREQVGPLKLNIPLGAYRPLKAQEVASLLS